MVCKVMKKRIQVQSNGCLKLLEYQHKSVHTSCLITSQKSYNNSQAILQ